MRESDMEDEADALNLAPDDALSVLEYWQASAARLMFVYRRSDGVFIQTGRGRIQRVTPNMLTFATFDGQLEVLVSNADFELGALPSFATRHTRIAEAEGLLVCLQNEDRLYLCASDCG
jgi:hypothetical protein